ncbi:MAG: hypothetical protein HY543_11160 [Deltaproteobacteria bacterium]|nr:hypothetical protein [Deltaproteobacteria bacterium]
MGARMRRLGWGLLGAALLCGVFASCVRDSMAYRRALREWTKHHTVYSLNDLRAELIVSATLLTPAFRDARLVFESALRDGEPGELPRAWDLSGTSVLIGLYAPKGMERLGQSFDDGYWQLSLTTPDGMVVHPIAVTEVPISPLEQKLFPHFTRWTRAYLVRFAPELGPGKVALTIAGLNARSTLLWNLR